jgi:uncharacterized protein
MVVTPLYAGLLALWYFVLSLRVSQIRRAVDVSLGDAGNPRLLRVIRGHSNFAEYVPLALLMLAILELNDLPESVLHAAGALLLIGRLLHGYALCFTQQFKFGRFWGIVLTLIVIFVEAVLCLYEAVKWSL